MPEFDVSMNLEPTLVEEPNVRYANTFLSDKYRDYAVNGEGLMDKVSGEYFIKRVTDGRVVSFNQNKRYIHDTVLELKIALANYNSFIYPYDSETAVYLSQNYDLAAINSDLSRKALTADFIANISNDFSEITNKSMIFSLSPHTNGFFCKPMSRDCDKALIEYFSMFYNDLFENYTGENTTFLEEAKKFKDDPTWKYNDTRLVYSIKVERNERENFAGLNKVYYYQQSVKLNEEVCILLDTDKILIDFENIIDKITVQISSLDYYKMHFINEHISEIKTYIGEEKSLEYDNNISKYISVDNAVQVNTLNIMYFANSISEVILCGNEFILALLGMMEISRYLDKLKSFNQGNPFILTESRPSDYEWGNSCIWAEHLEDVEKGNVSIQKENAETNILLLQQYYGNPHINYTNLSSNINDVNAFVINEKST